MKEIVINACYGGFSISKEAAKYMAERGHVRAKMELQESEKPLDPNDNFDAIYIKYGKPRSFYGYGYVDGMSGGYERDDPLLVEAVKTLGDAASNSCSKLVVVEIPDDVKWEISEYDGLEHIAEVHRTWS